MTVKFLKKVIETYQLCTLPYVEDEQEAADDLKQCEQSLTELTELEAGIGDNDAFNGDCYILPAFTVVDIMNAMTYDSYGKSYVSNNKSVSLNDYISVCKSQVFVDYVPTSVYELGYEVVSDLYNDNEQLGCHNADGTFNHSN